MPKGSEGGSVAEYLKSKGYREEDAFPQSRPEASEKEEEGLHMVDSTGSQITLGVGLDEEGELIEVQPRIIAADKGMVIKSPQFVRSGYSGPFAKDRNFPYFYFKVAKIGDGKVVMEKIMRPESGYPKDVVDNAVPIRRLLANSQKEKIVEE